MSGSRIASYQQKTLSSVAWKPHNYQKRAIKFLLEQPGGGVLLDPGLGKTSIVLAALKILKNEGRVRRTLVIAPMRVCYNVWPAEIQKWTDFNELRFSLLHGKDREKNFNTDADVYLINPEGLLWLCENNYSRFNDLEFDMLVVDESSKFKHTNSQRYKLLKPVLSSFKRRCILTGSPMPNGYLDLFGQVYILDLGHALSPYITHYRMQYFFPSGYGGYTWKLKKGADELIQKQIAPITLRLDAEDYLDMPELIGMLGSKNENVIWVDLPPAARNVYDSLEEEMLAVLRNGKVVTAVNAAVVSGKCAQVANGGIFHMLGDWEEEMQGDLLYRKRTWTNLHNAKVDAVKDLVDELQGSSVLVSYDYEHDLDRLTKVFPKAEVLGGNAKNSKRVEDLWNTGELDVMFGNPASMGHGLNLQGGGNHVIIPSLPWDYDHYDQFIRRVRRQGSAHKKVHVYHIAARNTVDVAKMAALRYKGRQQGGLLQALKNYAAAR